MSQESFVTVPSLGGRRAGKSKVSGMKSGAYGASR